MFSRGRKHGRRLDRRANGEHTHLMPSLAKDAELVAFGVRQHDPRSIPLADVHAPCAVSDQTSHPGVLVIRPKVEMQAALGLLALFEPDEVQPRRAIRLWRISNPV